MLVRFREYLRRQDDPSPPQRIPTSGYDKNKPTCACKTAVSSVTPPLSVLTVRHGAHMPHAWCLRLHLGMAQLGHRRGLGALTFLMGYRLRVHSLQCPLP